jgi:hypothetical protein
MRFNETSLGGHSSNRARYVLASEGTGLACDGVGLSMPHTDVQRPLGNCAVRLPDRLWRELRALVGPMRTEL